MSLLLQIRETLYGESCIRNGTALSMIYLNPNDWEFAKEVLLKFPVWICMYKTAQTHSP